MSRPAMRLTEKEVFIDAPWGKIAVLTWGNPSNPPVYLSHGKMDVGSSFRPLVSMLPDSFFYVSVDLPCNGKSDHLPKGVRFSFMNFLPTVLYVKEHFKWDKFIYIGHSLGALIGIYYNIIYPEHIKRLVILDPVPACFTFTPQQLVNWYNFHFGDYYTRDKYKKYNAGVETAPKYTYEKILEMTMNARGLTKEQADQILERAIEPVGNGLYRLTYDQRMKEVSDIPFPSEHVEKVYTMSPTPTFCLLAQVSINMGCFDTVPFIRNEKLWPNRNYSYKIYEGNHDFHINNPGIMAEDISKFLLNQGKAKL